MATTSKKTPHGVGAAPPRFNMHGMKIETLTIVSLVAVQGSHDSSVECVFVHTLAQCWVRARFTFAEQQYIIISHVCVYYWRAAFMADRFFRPPNLGRARENYYSEKRQVAWRRRRCVIRTLTRSVCNSFSCAHRNRIQCTEVSDEKWICGMPFQIMEIKGNRTKCSTYKIQTLNFLTE